MGFKNVFAASLFIFPVLLLSGCTRDSNDPGEGLIAYCVRECVIETSDAEICDTRCKCAAEKLAYGISEQEFGKIAGTLTGNDAPDEGYAAKFRTAFESCKGIK
jgi:hypothetical protein